MKKSEVILELKRQGVVAVIRGESFGNIHTFIKAFTTDNCYNTLSFKFKNYF